MRGHCHGRYRSRSQTRPSTRSLFTRYFFLKSLFSLILFFLLYCPPYSPSSNSPSLRFLIPYCSGMPICEAFAHIEQQPNIYDVVHVKYFDEVCLKPLTFHFSHPCPLHTLIQFLVQSHACAGALKVGYCYKLSRSRFSSSL